MTFTKIRNAARALVVNPKKDKIAQIIIDSDNYDYFLNSAINHVKLAQNNLNTKHNLQMAGRHLLFATIKYEESNNQDKEGA